MKRYISMLTVILFITTAILASFTQKTFAYQNSGYFNNLKVGLTTMASTSIAITLNGEYTINGQIFPSGTALTMKVNGTNVNMNGIDYAQINIIPNISSSLLTLTSSTSTYSYMGAFLIKIYNGKVLPINTIDIENYLKGVVGYEMSNSFPMEALKAQAVAARNYALSRLGWEGAKGYDFDNSTTYQVYNGYNAKNTNVISAVDATKGQVLLSSDKLVETLYSASDGGYTESSENVWGNYVSYLRANPDSYDITNWPNGNLTFTTAQMQSTLINKGNLSSTDTLIKLDTNSITRYTSGRVSNINIVYKNASGVTATKSFTQDKARTFLGLPSSMYNVAYDSSTGVYTFSGKGNGHGLGMSQIGAKNRGAAGQTYDQILSFYYQNSYLQNLIQKATIGSFTESASNLLVNQNISFNASASGGNGYGYLYKFVISSNGSAIFTQDYSSTNTLNYVPTTPGTYNIDMYVKDNFSTSDYDDKSSLTFTVYPQAMLSSFTINKDQLLVGQTLTANVAATSGSGNFLYKYEVVNNGTVVNAADYSTNTSFSYTTDTAGAFVINVYLKDANSISTYDDGKSLNFNVYNQAAVNYTSSQNSVLVGNNAQYNVSVADGSGQFTYKFVVLKDWNWVMTRPYSSDNTFTYTPTSSGTYAVYAYVKDALSDNDYDFMKYIILKAYDKPQISSVTANGYMYEGRQVTLSSAASGGSPSGINYRYEVYQNQTLIASNAFNTSNTFMFTPASAGTYTVNVYALDSLSSSSYDCVKTFAMTINKKPLYIVKLPLSYGTTSTDVTNLQNALIKLGYPISSATGYFGSQTKSAVISFQQSKGLTASGTVDTATYNALNDALMDKSIIQNLTF